MLKIDDKLKFPPAFPCYTRKKGGVYVPGRGGARQERGVKRMKWISAWADTLYSTFVAGGAWLSILRGLGVTLVITGLGLLLGLALGSAVYFALRSRLWPLRLAGRGYVSLVRGTPVLLLLMFLFYVVFARTRVDAIVVAVLAFGLNTAAYIAKIIESAVQAVEPGQVMAARTMGFTAGAAFRLVAVPQAVVFVRPMLQNLAVTTLQWTSVVGYITITDLTRVINNIGARSAKPFLVLGAGIALYLALAYLIGLLFRVTEPKRRWLE